MIETKQIISGTEEELLEYFKNKYNLVECNNSKKVQVNEEKIQPTVDGVKASTKVAVQVGNKVTDGIKNLFAGTSWG